MTDRLFQQVPLEQQLLLVLLQRVLVYFRLVPPVQRHRHHPERRGAEDVCV